VSEKIFLLFIINIGIEIDFNPEQKPNVLEY